MYRDKPIDSVPDRCKTYGRISDAVQGGFIGAFSFIGHSHSAERLKRVVLEASGTFEKPQKSLRCLE